MTAEGSTNAIQKIGRYRVTGELGRGGMGVVYRGEDRLIGRRVAIKTLTEVTPELRERFYIEARSGILSHPNIVTVYELGEHEGRPFIAMEFVEGDSLEKLLRLRKRLPLLEALSIVEQLCAGLGYAHGHGVVHRDVKPANVLMRPDGRVTIVDFGIARLADQAQQLTKTDTLLGSIHYIAPERLKGEASDGRADIWSVGVMLYEMLTGELPFKGSDLSSLYLVIHEPHVPLAEYVQDLPEGLSRVLDKALAKHVDVRYATAEEMAFDLQELAAGLKQDRVGTLIETARRLTEESQYASARTVLLQAQRIDPANIGTKTLLSDVQDRLSHMQRGEQLRQFVEQAQDAANGRRWNDAVELFQQARQLDAENAFNLDERLQQARKEKVQQQRVLALWKQAEEARNLGDLRKAQDYLGQALQIDDRSTELRNAYSDVLRELKRKQQQLRVEELLRSAREESGKQRYTEAIARLREAAEIDPVHAEVQELLFSVTARQKEDRRQQVLDQAASDVRESLDREDFGSAEDQVTRALETLPGDRLLLRLKSENEGKKRDVDVQRMVRSAVLEAQELFADHPERALRVIEQGLKDAPDSTALIQSRARLLGHLKDLEKSSTRAPAMEEAHAAQKARQHGESQRVLEPTLLEHGPSEDLQQQLSPAKAEQATGEQNAQRDAALREMHEPLQTAQFPPVIDGFEPLASANNDAGLTRLLEKTRRKQDEGEGKFSLTAQLTEVPLNVQLGEAPSSPQKQSQEVRATENTDSPEAQSRRAAEIRTAVEKAVAECDRAIARSELDQCIRPLDDLAKQYGESPALATAKEECESKREHKATQVLRDALQTAQRQLRNSSAKKAEAALKGVEYALPFAGADVRSEWQRLKRECAAALIFGPSMAGRSQLGPKQPIPKSTAPAKRGKGRWYIAGSAIAVAALAVLGVSHRHNEVPAPKKAEAVYAPAPAPAPPAVAVERTDVEINASPWAKVVSFQDKTGKSIALPDGDQTTPLRLDGVDSGTYEVTFAGADGKQQTVECNISAGEHLCAADLRSLDTEQLLMGEQQ
jgi:eukaryotic-like serine/threonine-protein kinase